MRLKKIYINLVCINSTTFIFSKFTNTTVKVRVSKLYGSYKKKYTIYNINISEECIKCPLNLSTRLN